MFVKCYRKVRRETNPDRFIASCKLWDDFYQHTKGLSAGGEKGAVFERLTQLYTTPEYRTEFQHGLVIA